MLWLRLLWCGRVGWWTAIDSEGGVVCGVGDVERQVACWGGVEEVVSDGVDDCSQTQCVVAARQVPVVNARAAVGGAEVTCAEPW